MQDYKYRAFLAIYGPRDTLVDRLNDAAAKVVNLNGKTLVRPLEQFPEDLRQACKRVKGERRLVPRLL